MGKNKGAGGKNRRKGKGDSSYVKEMIFKEEGQEYAIVTRHLGGEYLEVNCLKGPGVTMKAHIRGAMRRKIFMNKDDVLLVNIRDYQDDVCDILMKYTPDQVRILKSKGEIPSTIDDVEFNEYDDEPVNDLLNKVQEQNRNLDMPESDDDLDVDNL
jgi:translation initiation factor 1A